MRHLWFLCLAGSAALGGPLGAGFKVGVPVTGLVMSSDNDSGAFPSRGGRWVVGPTVELRLPLGLGIETDALYRSVKNPPGGSWEFPILAKYRVPVRGRVAPFLVGGGSFERNELLRAAQVGPATTTTGFVAGGGMEARVRWLRLSPEVRYTHWTGDFGFRGANLTHRDEVEFLVGVAF